MMIQQFYLALLLTPCIISGLKLQQQKKLQAQPDPGDMYGFGPQRPEQDIGQKNTLDQIDASYNIKKSEAVVPLDAAHFPDKFGGIPSWATAPPPQEIITPTMDAELYPETAISPQETLKEDDENAQTMPEEQATPEQAEEYTPQVSFAKEMVGQESDQSSSADLNEKEDVVAESTETSEKRREAVLQRLHSDLGDKGQTQFSFKSIQEAFSTLLSRLVSVVGVVVSSIFSVLTVPISPILELFQEDRRAVLRRKAMEAQKAQEDNLQAMREADKKIALENIIQKQEMKDEEKGVYKNPPVWRPPAGWTPPVEATQAPVLDKPPPGWTPTAPPGVYNGGVYPPYRDKARERAQAEQEKAQEIANQERQTGLWDTPIGNQGRYTLGDMFPKFEDGVLHPPKALTDWADNS